ncbi:hypothetical protein [Desulfofundulus thermosubterraneus]|uniref:Uncharacterized protein n=1 Tax=Desulfofundulus thermosubterraneus DSM 16057 TaxID=1121432 RepID=A0A1M6EJ20_9FIRM|nr:hypothetical protein [Desulfofundulus thermosubterraneus]SHI85502.1 hypothetical protein SAMN02745219_01215 [Desulfofundulus thermosubterraneus DSM 16057]
MVNTTEIKVAAGRAFAAKCRIYDLDAQLKAQEAALPPNQRANSPELAKLREELNAARVRVTGIFRKGVAMMKTLCYYSPGAILMGKIEELLQEINQLSIEEAKILYKELLRRIATPLRDPEEIYDDWNDPEVDKAYAKSW